MGLNCFLKGVDDFLKFVASDNIAPSSLAVGEALAVQLTICCFSDYSFLVSVVSIVSLPLVETISVVIDIQQLASNLILALLFMFMELRKKTISIFHSSMRLNSNSWWLLAR
ncbi:hypothetical protein NE237_021624 [Protea cynaroides]|uniref:Uncharacterized protein n=1 Tax=Protea cynaroides TaxID=273540 RepID=A0A9Q0K2S7_9MAGN|nr:hypothetical protein NE237_021624 [Protea cynaroides]